MTSDDKKMTKKELRELEEKIAEACRKSSHGKVLSENKN